MNHRHFTLFYATLVILALTLAGFNFPGVLKGSQKEKPAESEKTVEKEETAEIEEEEEKLAEKEDKEDKSINEGSKPRLGSKMFGGLKKAAKRLKGDKKAKKEDKLTENEETAENEKPAKNDKPYVVPAHVIDAFANAIYKGIIGKAKIEGKLIPVVEKKNKLFSKVSTSVKNTAKRLKRDKKAKKEDKLAENEEEGEKFTDKADKEDNSLNEDLKKQVRKVFRKLKKAAERSEYGELAKELKWEVNVIKDDKIENAFAWPGGKIAIYTGIWPFVRNEAGLAAVLGHEMIHALAQHAAHRFNRDMITGLSVAGLAVEGIALDKPEVAAIVTALGAGFLVGVVDRPFARKKELEADYEGLLLVANAGYEPLEASEYWNRFLAKKYKARIKWLSSHPEPKVRFDEMSGHMDEFNTIYGKLNLTEEEKNYSYIELVEPVHVKKLKLSALAGSS